jgi:hypothetical protein
MAVVAAVVAAAAVYSQGVVLGIEGILHKKIIETLTA